MLSSQLGNEGVFVIYMNLHPINALIYPPRDETPARILSEFVDHKLSDYTARCCSFFAAIFKVFKEHLKARNICEDNYLVATTWWHSEMCKQTPFRINFFSQVESEFKEVSVYVLPMIRPPNVAAADPASYQRA
jgi:hypothetical protein